MTEPLTATCPAWVHHYISTACMHGLCDERCRNTCKFCDAPCAHSCHAGDESRELPPPWVDQARGIARELLADIVEFDRRQVVSPELWQRIVTDPALFWLRDGEVSPGEWRPPSGDRP